MADLTVSVGRGDGMRSVFSSKEGSKRPPAQASNTVQPSKLGAFRLCTGVHAFFAFQVLDARAWSCSRSVAILSLPSLLCEILPVTWTGRRKKDIVHKSAFLLSSCPLVAIVIFYSGLFGAH